MRQRTESSKKFWPNSLGQYRDIIEAVLNIQKAPYGDRARDHTLTERMLYQLS